MPSDVLTHVIPSLLAIAEGGPSVVSDDEVRAALHEDLSIQAKAGAWEGGRGRVMRLTDFARGGGSGTAGFESARRRHYLHITHGLEMDEGQPAFWTNLLEQGRSSPRDSSFPGSPPDWSDTTACVRALRRILGFSAEIRAAVSLVAVSWGCTDEGVTVVLSASGTTTGALGV